MIKRITGIALLLTLLNGCASYSPIIDTNGRSKFETSNAKQITNDKILCKKFAKDNRLRLEVVVAPDFDREAIEFLSNKKKLQSRGFKFNGKCFYEEV